MNSITIKFMSLVIKLLLAIQKDNIHPSIIGDANEFLLLLERQSGSEIENDTYDYWLEKVEKLRRALLLVLDRVDYINFNCQPTDQVGTVLNKDVIQNARFVLAESRTTLSK